MALFPRPPLDRARPKLAAPEVPAEAVEHGEVFTRRWVVELILDLAGYTPDRDLAALRLVDPACGAGAFLECVVERLSESCRKHERTLCDAADAVRGFDLLARNVEASRRLVREVLARDGWGLSEAEQLAKRWVGQGDYLLGENAEASVDVVVGNPPYIRLEDVPEPRMQAYRHACPTMVGRADVYVGFYEVGLRSLKPGGVLAFICADRWMRNQYGRDLRRLITRGYAVETTITMHDVDAFEEQVSAYPAITVIRRAPQGSAAVAQATAAFDEAAAQQFRAWRADPSAEPVDGPAFQAARLPHWFDGADHWPAASPARLAMIEDLTDRFRPLEDPATRTRVGIGVATGADSVFVTTDPTLVEADRLLPLAMVRDTTTGHLAWSGHYLVNPWSEDGHLVDLDHYPRLRKYLENNATALVKRHVAARRPAGWYRTIDKVNHSLTDRPKLLFPDMKLAIHPVLDQGGHYPHHNLYYVVSEAWDLRVLGGLLLSRVAEAFVEAYAVKMRGGTLRFQAQYLRKIRVPDPDAIGEAERAALISAFERRDQDAATEAALGVYGLDELPA